MEVACGSCGVVLDASKADITGRGYRCARCSLRASLAADGGFNDVQDHLTVDERRQRAAEAIRKMIGGGALVAGGLVVAYVIPIAGAAMLLTGVGAMAHGLLTRRELSGERTDR
ncbi:MAG: hypothetical protein ACTHU0_06905 [Kofleriaceae bacterium]